MWEHYLRLSKKVKSRPERRRVVGCAWNVFVRKGEIHMARQTKLTLDELKKELDSPDGLCCGLSDRNGTGYPLGLLVNEVGEIFSKKGPDAQKAEDLLMQLLSGGADAAQWISFQYLKEGAATLSDANKTKFATFYEDPANIGLIECDD
jgi:hypothetical protein